MFIRKQRKILHIFYRSKTFHLMACVLNQLLHHPLSGRRGGLTSHTFATSHRPRRENALNGTAVCDPSFIYKEALSLIFPAIIQFRRLLFVYIFRHFDTVAIDHHRILLLATPLAAV